MTKRTNTAVWLEQYHRWQINVQKDGKRKTFSCSTPGRAGQRICNAKADAWLDDIVSGTKRVSFLWPKYMEDLKTRSGYSHYNRYDSYWRLYINPAIGHMRVSALDDARLQLVIDYAHKHPSKKKPLSKKYLENIRGALTNFVTYARRMKATAYRPENIVIPKNATRSNKKPMQPDDLKILFASDQTKYRKRVQTEQFIYAWRFAVVCGLRPGEVIGLTHRDIDGNICTIHGSINKFAERTSGKNENALRSFVIPPLGLKILADQATYMSLLNIRSKYIFPDAYGEAPSQQVYWKHWNSYRKYNGISETTPYEMRHTFFSVCKKLPPELVKQMGGHGKDMDTFGVYGHALSGEAELTASLVDQSFQQYIK